MLLGFKTELKLNNKQRTALAKHAGVSRHAWNWGLGLTKLILDHNQDTREDKIKFPTAIDLHKWLVALVKPICPWYYEVSKCAPQFALRQLDYEPINRSKLHPVVGVDLGIKALAVLSTGIIVEGAKSYRKYEKKLSRLQWLNRHKQIGSANWKKAQIKIARLHRRIANIRKDTLHSSHILFSPKPQPNRNRKPQCVWDDG